VIKTKTIRRAENVARIWGREMYARLCWGKPGERDHLEDILVDGRIILKWNLNK
jgi:hypothetical protein